jgi:hypothetical protein
MADGDLYSGQSRTSFGRAESPAQQDRDFLNATGLLSQKNFVKTNRYDLKTGPAEWTSQESFASPPDLALRRVQPTAADPEVSRRRVVGGL